MVEGGESGRSSERDEKSSTYADVGLATDGSTATASAEEAASEVTFEKETPDILSTLNIPCKLPSIVEIKRALPPHIFEPTVSQSMYYVVRDIMQVVGLFLLADWLWSSNFLPTWLLCILLPFYLLLQGTFFTSIFVVGHDAGHSSFSKYEILNDTIGNIFHAFLLCPYYCWKLTHRHHHKNTGNIDKDEVFYPIRKRDDTENFSIPGFGLGVGWFMYLLRGYGPRSVSHLNLSHPIFSNHVAACSISIALVFAWAAILWQYTTIAGFWKLLVHFIIPDFIFACYTVIITFLHHTEEDIPWYDNSLWDNVRGQLSSVDRHYGWCHDIIHNIGTHQIHHLFSKVPHYNLEEATKVFRSKFPQLVQVRDDRILPAFIRMFAKYAHQSVIPDDTKVHLYK